MPKNQEIHVKGGGGGGALGGKSHKICMAIFLSILIRIVPNFQ